jgi:hypothetical protein
MNEVTRSKDLHAADPRDLRLGLRVLRPDVYRARVCE